MPTAAIEACKQRWLEFYDPQGERNRLYWIHCFPGLGERPLPTPENETDRVDWAWKKYGMQVEQRSWLEDDSLPFLDIYTGTELFAEAFGCRVQYLSNDMPFALPRITRAEEVAGISEPGLDAPALARVFRIADELARRAGPGALLRLPDIQSPMDIAALIWEKAAFFQALVEAPEAVLELAGKVRRVLVAFLDEWFRRYGKAFVAHYPDYYMPYGITLSEDEVGSVSPAMFQRYFLPELVALSERYGQMGMHCCAHARHQWPGFLAIPRLVLLNLVQPPEVTRKAWTSFAPHTAQLHSYQGDGPAWTWESQIPPEARVVFDLWAENRQDAEELLAKLRG